MKSNIFTMTISLTTIACAMGLALGLVHKYTAEPIALQQEKTRTEALEAVLPLPEGGRFGQPKEITVDGDKRPVTLYPAESANGEPLGAAVETWTMDGFSGEITVMVGFDAKGKVTGYKVLQSSETPGLGDKASYWFQSDGESVDGISSASTRSKSIIGTTGPLKVSKDGGSVDGITAATITSRAFLGAINRARVAYEESLKHIE